MSFAPKQFIRSVDFLSTENAINTSTGCVNIYGGMSVSKDSYLTNMIVVGNSTVTNLNITGALITSTGNTLTSSQWTSIDSNSDIYFGTSANAFVGIGTTTPTFNLDISGGSRITGGLTVGNLNVNTGATITNILNTTICTGTTIVSGGITTSTIRVTGNADLSTGLTTVTDLTGTNITSATIRASTLISTANLGANNVSSGTIQASTLISTANLATNNFSSGTIRATTLITSANITANNFTANNLISSNITSSNLRVSGTINSGDITVGNINFTGSLYQNGSAYLGSQWTTTSGNTLTYTSGNVSINSGFSSTFNSNTLGNIFTTGGNVGIGIAPTSKLQVHASDFPNIKLTTDNVYVNSIDLDSTNKTGGVYWRLMSTHQDASEGQGKFVISQVTSGLNVLGLTSSGNVGIRTLNPSTTLDVSGTGRITTSLTTGALFSTNQTTTNIVGTNISTGTLNATTIATALLTASTSVSTTSLLATSASIGNISAASINLSSNLNVAGTLTVVNVTTTNLTMSNGNALLNLVTSGSILNTGTITSGPLMLRTPNNYDGRILTLSTFTAGNSYNLTIDAVNNTNNNIYWSLGQNTLSSTYSNMLTFYGGNVGINTTQPSSKFVISDTGATKGHLKLVANTGATEDNWWLGFCHVDSSDSNDRARIGVKIQGGGAGRLFFTTGGYGAQAERMTIDASGNIGIGTTSPGAKLQIDGPAGTGSNGSTLITGYDSYGHSLYIGSYAVQKRLAFNHNGTAGNIFAYDYGSGTAQNLVLQGPGGSVGIGTASPSARLHAFSSDTLNTMFVENNGGGGGTQGSLRVKVNATSGVRNILQLENGTSTVMLVRDDGNVGIGTTSPSTKVHIEDGSVFIGDVSAGFSTSVPSSAGAPIATANGYRLFFDNSYNATAGTGVPANKIVLHNNSFTCGFGIENTGVTYHSGDSHRFYSAATNSSSYGSLAFSVSSTNTIATTNTNSEGLLKIGNSNAGSSAYSMLRIGNNIGDAVMFLNSNTRTIDGGINTFTIRNDTGALRLQGAGATNTIFLPGSSTNVGINTSSPRANLEITQTSSTTGMMLYSGSNDGGVNRIIFNHSDTTSNYQKVSIETQASGSGQAGRGNFSIRVNTANDNTNVAAGDTRFFIHGTSGNVGIMTTSPSYPLHVSGDIYATGDVISFSDARLKSDVETITGALDKVSNMRGVYYTNLNTQTRETGVIAQEISEILPEVVADRGEYLGVAYGNIVGVLIEAIKELKAKVVELEARVN